MLEKEYWDYEDKSLLYYCLGTGQVPASMELRVLAEHSLTYCVTHHQEHYYL